MTNYLATANLLALTGVDDDGGRGVDLAATYEAIASPAATRSCTRPRASDTNVHDIGFTSTSY
jgi:hypothetical protein